jgi:hypothetical integral membrane protein (TIGR02206 family)
MNGFFSAEPNLPRFTLFSLQHIIPLVILITLVALLFLYKDKIKAYKNEKYIRYTIAAILLISDLSIYVWRISTNTFNVSSSMPLHLCTITAYVLMYVLVSKNQRIFNILFYAGFAGAIMALVNPEFGGFNYTQYRYYEFMIIHSALVIGLLYMVVITGFIPKFDALVKSYVAVHLYALIIVIPVNYLVDGTYMMLVNSTVDILNILGPWPMSAIVLEVLLLVLFGLSYGLTYLLVLRKEA